MPGALPCMAGATNPGNIGHAWVKALWIDKRPAPGMERPEQYDPDDYDFIRAHACRQSASTRTMPITARRSTRCRAHLRRAFLDGDWDVFAGQYFDIFDLRAHTARAEQIGLEAVVAALDLDRLGLRASQRGLLARRARRRRGGHLSRIRGQSSLAAHAGAGDRRAHLRRRAAGSWRRRRERIGEVFLSPDAFARRTSEADHRRATRRRAGAAATCRVRRPPTTTASAAGC